MTDSTETYQTSLALIDAIHDNVALARGIAASLDNLAYHFHMTGNDAMAAKLTSFCTPLEESAKRVQQAYGANQSAELRRNEDFSRDLIMGLVGMVEASAPDDPSVKKKARAIKNTRMMKGGTPA